MSTERSPIAALVSVVSAVASAVASAVVVVVIVGAAAAACDASLPPEEGPTVDVRVVADSAISTTQLASMEMLAIELSGAESASLFFDGAPVRERLVRYRPRATSGELAIAASARAAGGAEIASGQARVQLTDGRVSVTLTLTGRAATGDLGAPDLGAPADLEPPGDLAAPSPDLAGAPDLAPQPDLAPRPDLIAATDLAPAADLMPPAVDLGGAATLVIGPPSPWTFAGGTQAFVASEPVTWSVDGNAAAISAAGVFTAPVMPGTYTVRATTVAPPARTASTTITVKAGSVDLVAGAIGATGSADHAGAHARFTDPWGMTHDGAGKLYLTEQGGYTVREIDVASGAVRTIAGLAGYSDYVDGVGSAARFCGLTGLAVVGGYLYAADWNCPGIRRIDIATGETTVFAGNGDVDWVDGVGTAARFEQPWGLATDGTATLWVADNQTLRKVDVAPGSPTYGKVTTVLGDNAGGATPFVELSGLAWLGPAPGVLFAADQGARRILKITALDATTPTVSNWAGDGTQGTSDSPLRVRFMEALWMTPTRLFFSDLHAVRAVDIAGDGSAGAALTLAGDITTTGYVNDVGAAARFSGVEGIAVAGNTMYVADSNNHVIRAVDVGTRAVTTFAGRPNPNATPADGVGANGIFVYPGGVAYAGGSIAYVADRRAIRRVDFTSGDVSTPYGDLAQSGRVDGNGTAARFTALAGIVLVGRTLYATDETNHNVRAIDLDTNEVTTFAGDTTGMAGYADGIGTNARFSSPMGIVSDGTALYVAAAGTNTIRRIDLATRQVTTVAGSPYSNIVVDGVGAEALLGTIYGLAYEGGAIWFGSSRCLRRLDPTTRAVTTVAGCVRDFGDGTGTDAGLRIAGRSLTGDGEGHVYLADYHNGLLRRYDVAWGTLSTVVGSFAKRGLRPLALPSTLNGPSGVALVGPQDFLVTDSDEHAFVRIH